MKLVRTEDAVGHVLCHDLTKIVKDDDSSRQDKIKAIDTMNKMDGVYVQKTQLSGSVDTGDIIIEFSNEVDDGDKI